jgi:hypothetical protein
LPCIRSVNFIRLHLMSLNNVDEGEKLYFSSLFFSVFSALLIKPFLSLSFLFSQFLLYFRTVHYTVHSTIGGSYNVRLHDNNTITRNFVGFHWNLLQLEASPRDTVRLSPERARNLTSFMAVTAWEVPVLYYPVIRTGCFLVVVSSFEANNNTIGWAGSTSVTFICLGKSSRLLRILARYY